MSVHNRWLRKRASIYFILIMLFLSTLVSIQLFSIKPAFASPGSSGGAYDSHPTAHADSAQWTVTTPADAYDGDWSTYASIPFESVADRAFDIYWEVTTFDTTGAPTSETIRQVDVNIRYEADAPTDVGYDIRFYRGASDFNTLLSVSSAGPAHSIPGIGYDSWSDQARPGGGTWAWADMSDLKIRITNNNRGRNGGVLNMYEAWVTVINGANITFIYPVNRTETTTLTPDPSLTIRPDGDGSNTAWTGAYTDWDEADPHDGDSTYVSTNSAWNYETSTLDDHTSETGSIASVKLVLWARNTTATDDKIYALLWIGGSEYWGEEFSFTNETSGGTYMKFTSDWALNPDTETYWTWSDIDALEAGVVSYSDSAWDGPVRVTQLYVEVHRPMFAVDIWVNYVANLYSFQFELMFNPEVLHGVNYQGVKPFKLGPFLGSVGGAVEQAGELGYDNSFGRLFLTGAFISFGSKPTGTGLLGTIFFEVVGKGESNLMLGENTGLLAPPPPPGNWIAQGREYVQDGYFRNAPLASMPKPAYTVTPVSTPASLEGFNSTFDATSSTPNGGTIVTYKWYFWDVYHGRTYLDWGIVTDSVTTRNFTMRGTYNITLIVIDDAGFVGIKETYFTILAHDIFFSDITTNATLGPLPPTIIPMANIGDIVEVNATVVNEGDFTETNVNVTLFWSANYDGADHYGAIGTQYGITLTAGESRNITFTWDTTGRNVTHSQLIGLHANASRVQYEYDTERVTGKIADNEIVREGPRVRFHDVAITQVTTNATFPVLAGDVVEVYVTVVNQGDYNETSISVTTYYDGTSISTQMIQVMTNSSFADDVAGIWEYNSTITLTFLWDTTGAAGTHTLKANTSAVLNDYEPYDNTFIFGSVTVTGGVPEFPFGAALEIALVVVVIYVWRRKSRRKSGAPTKTFSRYQTGKTLNVNKHI